MPPLISTRDNENLNGEKEISAWVHIAEDDQVTIFNPAAEMGQGSMTALAVIIAEELDVDWNKVTIKDSPIEPEIYGLTWGGKLGGSMITVGSRTVRGYYHALPVGRCPGQKNVASKCGR